MRLLWVEARDFRNHRHVWLEVPPGLTAVVGPNGRGKTNLLEAVHYLCALSSPRVSADLPLVRLGAGAAYLRGEVEAAGRRLLIEVEVQAAGHNHVQVNRSPVRRRRDVRAQVRVVFCGPDDLPMVQGDPAQRRRFLDQAVGALWPAREGAAAAYDRALRQRNRLLREWGGPGEPPGLAAWDEELVARGTLLTELRAGAVDRLRTRAVGEFARLAGGFQEQLVVEYLPSVGGEPREQEFRRRLAERREDELVRRTTLVGPHRDDLGLSVAGLAARGFASHGEGWGAAVALRLALAGAVAEEVGEPPILLLDDPFSGLDPERRARLAGNLAGRGQVLMAVPDPDHVPAGAEVWRVGEGAIVPA